MPGQLGRSRDRGLVTPIGPGHLRADQGESRGLSRARYQSSGILRSLPVFPDNRPRVGPKVPQRRRLGAAVDTAQDSCDSRNTVFSHREYFRSQSDVDKPPTESVLGRNAAKVQSNPPTVLPMRRGPQRNSHSLKYLIPVRNRSSYSLGAFVIYGFRGTLGVKWLEKIRFVARSSRHRDGRQDGS